MTEERMALVELLQKSGDGDFLRAVAEAVLQILMEADVEGLIGAGRHERSADRLNYRNGYRDRSLEAATATFAAAIAAEHGTEVRAMAKKVIRGVGAGRWYSRRRIRRRAEQPVQFRRFKALLVALFGGAGGLMEFVDESERVGQCYRCGSTRRAFTPA